jgi:AcrR family transcriptional regulator
MLTETLSRKDQVTRAATELFRQKGYSAASMRDLAQNLGIEPASLYSHIRSKGELLQTTCFNLANQLTRALDLAEITGKTASEKLSLAIGAHCEVLTNDTAAAAVFLQEWRHLTEPYLADFLKMREQYEARFREIVKQGIQEGDFAQVDEKLAVLTILASLNWIHHWFRPEGKMTSEQIGQQITRLLLFGLVNSTTTHPNQQ